MGLTIVPCDATLGATVRDVDLRALDEASGDRIARAFLEHAVLIFPGQALSADEQVVFAKRFGAIERLTPDPNLEAVPISNVKPDGTLLDASEDQILRGNEGWHTDSSYMPLAAKASALSAHVVTDVGGETEWADMRAAYDALDDATRERIGGLSAYHSLYHSQAKIGHDAKPGGISGFHTKGAPLRPLVKIHPETGRKALYVGRHAYGIPGLREDASERLLQELVDFACQPPRVLRHVWQPGDLVIWDNRAVLHRARPYDTSRPRVMVHTRIAGDPASEQAPTHADHR